MRTFFLYACFLISALFLVSPLSYPVIAGFGLDVEPDSWTENWAKLLALALFFPLIRWQNLGGIRELGWPVIEHPWRPVLCGLLEGMIVVAPVGLLLYLTGYRVIASDFDPFMDIGKAVVAGLIGGLLIGVIEETFFRGAVLQTALKRHSVAVAVLVSSLFYGAVHFIQVQALPADAPYAWYNGTLEVANGLLAYFTRYFDLASFSTLVAAGMLMAAIRLQDGHLYRAMGVHAGAVLVIRIIRSSTEVDHAHPWHWLAGSYDYVTGWPATLWLTAILYFLVLRGGAVKY